MKWAPGGFTGTADRWYDKVIAVDHLSDDARRWLLDDTYRRYTIMDPMSTSGLRNIPILDTKGIGASKVSGASREADATFELQDTVTMNFGAGAPQPMAKVRELAVTPAAVQASEAPAPEKKKIGTYGEYLMTIAGVQPGQTELFKDLGLNGPGTVQNQTLYTLSGQPINAFNKPPIYLLQE